MTNNLDGWNIVLAGHWNRMIFTPEWVATHLFHTEVVDIETAVSLLPIMPILFRHEDVALEVSSQRLIFQPRSAAEAVLRRSEEMASTVLDLLPRTPMIATGVNFAFSEPAPPDDLVQLFDGADGPLIAQEDWDVNERSLIRRLRRGDDMLNLTLTFGGGPVAVDFNYHREAATNEAALASIRNRVVALRDASLNLLRDVYQLSPEGVEARV